MRPGAGARGAVLFAWLALLALLGVYVQRTLTIAADLRLFMPAPQTSAERLLIDEIGEGPAARLMLIALEGADAEDLAASSTALADALRGDPAFRFVANGDAGLDDIPEALLAYRYLLSPTLDTARFDAAFLRAEIEARVRDLASPAGALLEDWLPRDPTLETLKLAEAWQPASEPTKLYDVWFDAAETRALLVAETQAPGFDPEAQSAALERLRTRFEATRSTPRIRLVVSGPGVFAVHLKDRIQGEAQWLGALASVGMIALMLVAYRRVSLVVLGVLPLVSAALAGLAAVSAVFEAVHGITLAFGITLIGVAQDYPLHLFSHQHRGVAPRDNARALWPTLATGVASTCIAYFAFLASGVTGLAQLACFAIVGLAVAGLTTRYVVPALLARDTPDWGASRALGRVSHALAAWPAPRWVFAVLALASVAVIAFAPGPLWENNLSTLTPVPKPLLEQDMALREALAAPDVRYLMVIEAESGDAVLARGEALAPRFAALVASGAIAGYDMASRYVPSRAVQLRRRAALPDAATLRAALDEALRGTPFMPGVFEPFLTDVEHARTLPPLTRAAVAKTPLEIRLAALLLERDGRATGLVSFTGVRAPTALVDFAASAGAGVTLLDLKDASETLVARYRERILMSLAAAALLLVGVVWFSLRDARRVRRVLAPMALTTLLIVAGLHGFGVSLGLFHLVALVLAAGLGLDYALFFEHASANPYEQNRTLHAVLTCAASTLMVFALLATSSIPVLRAIGLTVTLGVLANFVFAVLLTRRVAGDTHARA